MIDLIVSNCYNLVKTMFQFYIYSTLLIIINTWIGLDFGLTTLYVRLLDKIFKFVERNEKTIFFRPKNRSKSKVSISENDGDKNGSKRTIDHNDSYFTPTAPDHWNLLTTTYKPLGQTDYELTLAGQMIYFIGFLFRFGLLFPIRLLLFIYTLIQSSIITQTHVHLIPSGKLSEVCYNIIFRVCIRSASQITTGHYSYHQTHNCHQAGGILVSNHTGFSDILCLGSHMRYSFIARRRGGFLRIIYSTLEISGGNVLFDLDDKDSIKDRLRERAADPVSLPIIVFPEGTCTPSNRIMKFRKGSLEIGSTVHPVAIKWDLRYGDPFWNSKQVGFLGSCIKQFTNWATVADVYFLDSVKQKESESSLHFTERVRDLIANKIGLEKIDVDGYKLKYSDASGVHQINNGDSDLKENVDLSSLSTLIPSDNEMSVESSFSKLENQSHGLDIGGELMTRSF